MTMRANRNFTHVGEIAGLDQQTPEPQHLQAFAYGFGHASTLDDYIGATSMRQFPNRRQAVWLGGPSRIEYNVSPEFAREIQPVIGQIHGHNGSGAQHPC